MKQFYLISAFLAVLALGACRKRDLIQPSPPDTRIFVDKINLNGAERLGTSVELHWTGYSSDGYITGYEISFDQVNWAHTSGTDSTFLFLLEKGRDSSDIHFYVRAIDNRGVKDPTPASLVIPIKNSPPQVLFNTSKTLPDTVYTVFSIEWAAHDPDGDNTLDSLFIRFNEGDWYPLSPSVSFASFIPENVSGSGKMNAMVYKNLNPVLLSGKISGLMLNGLNKLYIRAKDNAGAYSATDSTGLFYVKSKSSDLLLINANSNIDPANDPLRTLVSQVYGHVDYVNYVTGGQKYMPLYWNPALNFQIKLYDKVFIYTDGLRSNGKLILEYASTALSDYLNNGGKLLVSTSFPSDIDPTSSVFSFSPVDSISTSKGQARFLKDSLASPDPVNAPGYPALQNSTFILGFEPFYPKPDARIMYRAHLARISNWVGPDIVAATAINTSGKTNQVFWAADLSLMNEDMPALSGLFKNILLNEFKW